MTSFADDRTRRSRAHSWVHWLAFIVAAFTLVLLSVGGHVTTVDAGDTEPAWSLRFWDWFVPWTQLEGGHFYEMFHRQLGTIVGFLAIAMAAILWKFEKRKWLRYTGYIALVLIILQGLLGGLRVLVVSDVDVQQAVMRITGVDEAIVLRVVSGMVHGSLGVILFAMMAVIATASSKRWDVPPVSARSALTGTLRRLGVLTTLVVFLQVVLGAYLRHSGWHTGVIILHAAVALLVGFYAVIILYRSGDLGPEVRNIRVPAFALAMVLQVQIFLGIHSFMVPSVTAVRTLHQIVGAILFALCVILTVRAYHVLEPHEPREIAPEGLS